MYQLDLETKTPVPDDDTLYPYINNDIEYRLFEDIVDSYYLDSQIKDDFQCDHDCYTHQWESAVDDHSISCTHAYYHIVQHIQDSLTVLNNILYIPWKKTCHYSQMMLQLPATLYHKSKFCRRKYK